MHVLVLFDRETEAVGIGVVLVAMQLHEQQEHAGEDEAKVGRVAEALERRTMAPQGEQRDHCGKRGDLPKLDAETGRKTEAVEQTEAEHSRQQVRRLHLEVLLETAVVVEALVDDADRDDGVDQVIVPRDLVEGREDQRDAVPDGEHRDELGDVLEAGEEEDHPEQKQQVVIAGQHVRRAEADVLEIAAAEHALAVGFRDAVGERVEWKADGDRQGRKR
ncbi:unnamed protein product [Brugia timori]|uniref:Secreted protein n=1 Tax=Brugia timori TaxID=42155 RepID=A0A0R3R5H7_9BILA|nr:unnamed protein product [Brugia timori]